MVKKGVVLVLLPVIIGLSLVYFPNFWVFLAVFVDFYTPWVLFDSPLYEQYHQFLINRQPDIPSQPLIEIPHAEATFELVNKLSKGFTWPIVIRGALENSTALDAWKRPDFWQKYASEEVLCGTLFQLIDDCTMGRFLSELEAGKPFYISGASVIFDNNPELHDMIDTPLIRTLEPGLRKSTQIFMGVPDMGSDIHCAIGINIFRQIVGQKHWWFIPVSQTYLLKPSINSQGFSAHTKTLVGKGGVPQSPWMKKIERYESTLNPGDILFNPPWFWHGIINLGDKEKNELVIGSPSRYGAGEATKAGIRTNLAFTLNAIITLYQKYGPQSLDPNFKMNMQADIKQNRGSRQKEIEAEAHPFELAD